MLREEQLKEAKADLIAYMRAKILLEDWHAVSDVANDLREIDAKAQAIGEFQLQLGQPKFTVQLPSPEATPGIPRLNRP